jgi:acyl-CoA reductase-like NAD-dependent aldehyde dehydrogenase
LQDRLGSGLIEDQHADRLCTDRLAEDRCQYSNANSKFRHGELIRSFEFGRARMQSLRAYVSLRRDKQGNEGATLVAGGEGRPKGLDTGYYVRPTVFADVDNHMTIAREEIFGPVLCVIGYRDVEDAIKIANDTVYGLAAYVQSASEDRATAVAARIEAGMVYINGAGEDPQAPFGGYKMSGNGREWGEIAFGDFLETKAVIHREAA